MPIRRGIVLASALLALSGCDLFSISGGGVRTTNGELAGGGVRTTNGEVAGRIKFPDASPAEGIQIRLYRVFLSQTGENLSAEWAGISDSTGGFRFQNVGSGTFAMSVTDPIAKTRAILPRISKAQEGLILFDAVLAPWVALAGRVLPVDGGDPTAVRICVPGLAECVAPGPDSVFTFPRAPQGEYDLVFLYKGAANYLPIRMSQGTGDTAYLKDIPLNPGAASASKPFSFYTTDSRQSVYVLPKPYSLATSPAWYAGKAFDRVRYFTASADRQFEQWDVEDYLDWKRHKLLAMPAYTTTDPAKPALKEFPCFLRLTSADIDFSQANPDGSDFRISRGDISKHLAYSIERWDPVAGVAEIWVSIDNLVPDNATQSFNLHWGLPEAQDRSDPAALLGSTPEARQVWPFDDASPLSLVVDKRGTHPGFFTGPGATKTATSGQAGPGVLGGSLALDGATDLITIDPHPVLDYPEMTISVWARNMLPRLLGQQYLAVKGEDGKKQWHLALDSTARVRFGFGKGTGQWSGAWVSRDPVSGIDGWRHYAGTFKAGEVHVYVDGVEMAAGKPNGVVPKSIPAINSTLFLGKGVLQTEPFWGGRLDHLTLENQARSADWIRMIYTTQKPKP